MDGISTMKRRPMRVVRASWCLSIRLSSSTMQAPLLRREPACHKLSRTSSFNRDFPCREVQPGNGLQDLSDAEQAHAGHGASLRDFAS